MAAERLLRQLAQGCPSSDTPFGVDDGARDESDAQLARERGADALCSLLFLVCLLSGRSLTVAEGKEQITGVLLHGGMSDRSDSKSVTR